MNITVICSGCRRPRLPFAYFKTAPHLDGRNLQAHCLTCTMHRATLAKPLSAESLLAFGYMPGHYLCTCRRCDVAFEGDKQALHCVECATLLQHSPDDCQS